VLTVLSVIGTRPEAIKMAPVVTALAGRSARVRSVVCLTGQHRELLDQALAVFDVRADEDLAVMEDDQTLAGLTARLVAGLDGVVEKVKPDWVLAQGDTTTVMAASLVAYYHGVSFGHVEAGLRTGDKRRPFPEEMNRKIADDVADAHFAPTAAARAALLREGVAERTIHVTGNTAIDALLDAARRPYDWGAGPLAGVPLDRRLVLVTAHRRESFGAPLASMCEAVADLARADAGLHVVYPVHLNPHVASTAARVLGGVPNVTLTAPLDYLGLVHLMRRSALILTDSGGIQEEAPTFGVPVLVLREVTERPEGVAAGVARVVGTERAAIVAAARRLLDDPAERSAMARAASPYGDGHAARRIVAILLGEPWEAFTSAG
jgi:UDP-N-acetylglucosamine 2-epimerase (non-hydrolysing)